MSSALIRIVCLCLFFVFGNISVFVLHAQDAKKTSSGLQPDYSAEAYVVEESIDHWSFESDGTGERKNTVSLRVQSEAGVQRFGVLTFPYQKATETVEVDYVRVRKPDGSIVATPLDDMQDMLSNIAREAPFYSDLSEKHVPVRGLSSGDILEFQCRWRQTKPLVPGQFWMGFQFSREEIVLKQVVQVSVPRDRAVKVKSPELVPAVSEEGARRVYTWTRSNLQRQITPKADLAQLAIHGSLPAPDIQLSSFENWEKVGRWYEGLQRERIVPTKDIREKAAELTRDAPDDAAKLRAIYKYVSTEFRYIGVAFGIGRYQPHSASEVLSNHYGDCKDKHTLMASLLAAAGIPAYPALINSSRVLDLDVPSPAQFDHVITVVPQGKEIIWLDTTSEIAPFGYLIPQLRNKRALVTFPEKPPNFEATPLDPPFPGLWVFKIDAKLDDSGTLEGKVEQSIRGDMEVPLRAALRSLPRTEWKNLIQQLSYATGFAGEVSDASASAPELTEKPLQFFYHYKRKDYPDWKQHRVIPPAPDILSLPSEEDGKLPSKVWLGAPGEFQFESRVELPEGYIAELPKRRDLQQEFIEYHSTYAQEGNVIIARYRILLKGREVSGAAVNDYKAFAEKAYEDRNQFILLSSGKQETAKQAGVKMQNQIWGLPDSSDPKALEAENEARAAIQRGSLQGAIDGFKRAVTLDSKFTRDWIFLGQFYMASKQKDAGVDAFRKAVDSDPQQPVPYKVLAFALMSLDRYDEAIRVWQDLAKIAPEDHDVSTNMGSLLVARKRYHEAVPFLETAVKLYPQKSELLVGLAAAYLHDGEDEKALGVFDKLLQLEPGAGAKNNIAYLLADANKQLHDALRYAQEAVLEEEAASRKVQLGNLAVDDLKHTGNLGAYWDTLGWVHYRLGDLKEAEGYLHAAWTVRQDSVIGYHLGQVYEKQQRNQDAVHMYRLAVSQQSRGGEGVDSSADAQKRLEGLNRSVAASRTQVLAATSAVEELGEERMISLPRLVSGDASAEFFVLLAPGSKVEDTKFISGSDQLRSAGKALAQAHFNAFFPENSSAYVVRRGILSCDTVTGCNFVLMPVETVNSVE
jgi:tetratricopeptide (TPR) repeat protein/transglutaminase-like putative cysteine protease